MGTLWQIYQYLVWLYTSSKINVNFWSAFLILTFELYIYLFQVAEIRNLPQAQTVLEILLCIKNTLVSEYVKTFIYTCSQTCLRVILRWKDKSGQVFPGTLFCLTLFGNPVIIRMMSNLPHVKEPVMKGHLWWRDTFPGILSWLKTGFTVWS